MPSPKRVIFNGKFLSAGPTGVHRVARELIRNIGRLASEDRSSLAGAQLELWVPSDAEDVTAEEFQMPVQRIGGPTGIPWEQLVLPFRAGKDMVVSLCNVGPMLSKNAITMFHDAQVHISPKSYSFGFRTWYHIHQPVAGRRHKTILTVSNFSKQQLADRKIAPSQKIVPIWNGVDQFREIQPDPTILSRLTLQPRNYVVGLANTQAHKNIGLLLRVFQRPELQGQKLVLFGSATADDFKKCGHSVPDNTLFAGRVNDPELSALYQSATCLAFPSTTEGFGLPPLEAMVTGCPAVIAPCGALPEVCGEAALVADPDDAKAWADAIFHLANEDDFYGKQSRLATAHAAQFTWDRAAKQLLEEIKKAM